MVETVFEGREISCSEGLDPSDGDTLYIMSFLGLIAHDPPMNDTVGVRARLAVAESP